MSTEQEGPASPEATPTTGEPGIYDGRADEHARARAEAQAHATARARAGRGIPPPQPLVPDALPTPAYAGLLTRTIGFGVDALAINTVAIATAAVVGLAIELFNVPSTAAKVIAAIGGVVYVLWTMGYFITFWATTGQTPGARLMRIRVLDAHDASVRIKPRRALLRLLGMALSAFLLFTGFLLVLVDNRRRGLHDRIARTVVVYLPDERV